MLKLTARDMVKLGGLYLNDGIWQSQQLVPAAWVKDATAPIRQSAAYGRMWWIVDVGEHHGYAALPGRPVDLGHPRPARCRRGFLPARR